MRLHRSPIVATLALASAAALVGCGSSGAEGPGGGSGTVDVVASFYPLQWIAEGVGGEHVDVQNLTPSGAEPHDLELTPKDVAAIGDADLVFYLSNLQPSVDDAIDTSGATALDAADSADLDLVFSGDGHEHEDEHEEGEEHAEEEGHDHEEETGATDPHFWLDPVRVAAVADAFATELAEVDPDHAADYEANAKALTDQLDELDGEFEAGLADCTSRTLVTTHTAFGYLAQRYDLEQMGIAGVSPSQEPSPADLAEVTDFVKDNDVQTIYFETLVSPAIAETIASETGAKTAVLDPLEGLTDQSDGDDYLAVMRSNLANLQAGQPCP